MTYEDIAPCPQSYRVSFLVESRNAESPVRAKFRCMAITHTVCTV